MLAEWFVRNQTRLATAVAATSWAAPALVFAQGISRPENVPTDFGSFNSAIRRIFNIVIIVAGIVFVILFLVGGIQYLGAAGNEDNTKKARQLMLDAVIGIIIVVASWAIGTYVLQLLGVPGASDNRIPTGVQ